MSSPGSPRQVRRRRGQRMAAVSLVATASLLGTYLGALRPQPTYAAPGGGQVGTRNGLAPPLSGCEDVPGVKTYVDDDTTLQAAITSSVDGDIICITGTSGFRLSQTLVLDDTSITLMGDDSSISLLPPAGGGSTSLRHLDVSFSDGLDDDSLVIRSLTFTGDDTVSYDGAAINIGDFDAQVYIVDSVFSGNVTTGKGGAVSTGVDARIYASHFIGNHAAGSGGAVYTDEELTVRYSSFSQNTASDEGGAIYSENDTLSIYNSEFSANSAVEGGAISSDEDVDLFFSEFSANQADVGGAVLMTNQSLDIYGTRFTGNVARDGGSAFSGRGGAIFAVDAEVNIYGYQSHGSIFETNHADHAGGAVYMYSGSELDIDKPLLDGRTGATFLNNTAGIYGGGVAIFQLSGADKFHHIYDSTFVGNRVLSTDDTAKGGGILHADVLGGYLIVYGSYFANNSASLGGGLAAGNLKTGGGGGGGLVVDNSAFVGNDASNRGGGLYASALSGSVVVVTGSSFVRNGDDTAPGTGGGIQVSGYGGLPLPPTNRAYLFNSTISGNRATQKGAGVYWGMKMTTSTGDPYPRLFQLSYLTVAENALVDPGRGVDDGGGIYTSQSVDTAFIVSSVLWNNTVDDDTASDIGGSSSDDSVTLVTSSVTSVAAIKVKDSSYPIFGDPLLGALGDNGGPRIGAGGAYFLPTARPAWNSPVITTDVYPQARVPSGIDQLGATRGSPAVLGAVLNSAKPSPPAPVIPPSAPLNVSGVGGDAEATITWSAPSSAGSFPVSTFQAVVSPGGQTCLSASSPCVISGLSNGTEYTVAVRALSGAGWGAFSNPSAPFTPEAPPVEKSILITGTRGEVRGRPGVIVSGSSTGMAGEQVAPWVKFPGQTSYTEGVSRVTVNAEGDFTWQRRTGKKIYVYFRAVETDIRSSRIVIRP